MLKSPKKSVSLLYWPKKTSLELRLVSSIWNDLKAPHHEGLFLDGANRALINHVVDQAIFHSLLRRHKEITIGISLDFV